ncbi:MAG: Protein of unknown function (DUF1553)/Protein of unknown function (DUF1549)/Planctomycete [Planctomycetota bacterium]|nr:Protein of unknown function (DUF1553)/Protein of unknown function (DUF1549)/Planctomycete [Planctomycetota bacterium]
MSVRSVHASVWLSLVILTSGRADGTKPVSIDDAAFFESRVRPVLVTHCQSCHGPEKQKSGLRLDSMAHALLGGAGGPAIVPGEPEKSPLIEAVRQLGEVKMPPKEKLPDQAIADLTEWVRRGAPWPETKPETPRNDPTKTHWAFRPVGDPVAPNVKNDSWPRSTIDRFILAKLEARGLEPSPIADRRTLIRRATFDLIGLPPSPQEVAAFEADPAPIAESFGRVVDRLLASPHYGERWGRHWLDVARYADTKGYVFTEEGNFPWSYAYRDWVVRALNEDLPYDQFLIQQMAADRLPLADDKRALAAMGFLTIGSRFMNNDQDILDDRIDVVTRGVMGLTVSCARCHDHKFDPIPTQDYYSLYGVFASSREPTLPPLFEPPPKTPQYESFARELENREKKLSGFTREKYEEVVRQGRSRVAEYLLVASRSRSQPDTGEFMLIADKGDLNPVVLGRWQRYLRSTREPHHPVFGAWHALSALPKEGFAERAASLIAQLSAKPEPSRPINPLILRALTDHPPANLGEAAKIFGEVLNRTELIAQDFARRAALNGSPSPVLPDPAHEELRQVFHAPNAPPEVPFNPTGGLALLPDRASQGQFKELLSAVETWRATGPGAPPRGMVLEDLPNPFNSRVFRRGNPGNQGEEAPRRFLKLIAGDQRQPFKDGSGRLELARAIAASDNPLTSRVLVNRVWMHHFGSPIVGTPGDFGLRSDPPSHPELLDHLARSFVADGWSVKRLHRRMMLSSVYLQSSQDRPESRASDPENALYWKMNRRRVDFEATRDALLAVSGRLDRTLGGPPIADILTPTANRRTLYGKVDRLNLPGLYRAFDYPDPSTTNPRRDQTTVAPQALFLMNHPFAIEAARAVLKRPELASETDLTRRVDRLYHLLYGRAPSKEELAIAGEFLGQSDGSDWDRYVQGLMIANEFVFVD